MQNTNHEIVSEICRNEHLINLISNNISSELDAKLQQRESRHLTMIGGIAAVVMFIGYQGIKEMISTAANTAAEAEVQRKSSNFDLTANLSLLALGLDKASREKRFSDTEKYEIMLLLEKLAKLNKEGHDVVSHPSFLRILESTIDLMFNSDNQMLVDRAFDLFPNECLNSREIVTTLLPSYGLLSVTGVGSISREALKRFEKLERTSSTHKLVGLALLHRLLIDFVSNKDSKIIENTIVHFNALEPDEKEFTSDLFNAYLTESWIKNSSGSGESKSLKKVALAFIETYGTQLSSADLSFFDNESHMNIAN